MNNQQPKRRRNKDNPYHISRRDKKFYLTFKDGLGVAHELEIEEPLYQVFNEYELKDLSFLNEWDRHLEHSVLTEATLNQRAMKESLTIEDIIVDHMENELLHNALVKLPAIQRRRLILYFFGCLTYEQIATLDGCTKRAVKYSIDFALKNIKKILEKF